MMGYTIEQIKGEQDINPELALWLVEEGENISKQYDGIFDHKNFDFVGYAKARLFFLCRKDGKPVGFLMCRLFKSGFDRNKTVLMQDLMYVKSPSFRTAHVLMQHFIDFGKSQADHIVTMIGLKTNIKPISLEKLGFSKFEELYRMEM